MINLKFQLSTFLILLLHILSYSQQCILYCSYDSTSDGNKIYWGETTYKLFISKRIYREDSLGNYELIGENNNLNPPKYIDTSISASIKSARYKIAHVDSLGNEYQKTPYCQTVLLSGVIDTIQNTYSLLWNKYIHDCYPPIKYYILRGQNPNSLSIIDSVSIADTIYIDNNYFSGAYYQIGYSIEVYGHYSEKIGFSNYINSLNINIDHNSVEVFNYIYPNPFSDYTTILFSKDLGTKIKVILTNFMGRKINEFNIFGEKSLKIYKSDLSNGLYFITLIGVTKRTYKLIIN